MRRRNNTRRSIDIRVQAIIMLCITIVSAIVTLRHPLPVIHPSRYILFSSFFESASYTHPGASSVELGILMTILISLSLYFVAGRVIQDNMKVVVLPFLYPMICSFSPYLLCFNQFHIVTLLTVWSLYLVISFRMDEHNLGELFFSLFLVSASSLVYTPAIWLCLVIFLLNISVDFDKLRYLVMTISAVAAPYLLLWALQYLFKDFQTVRITAGNFSYFLFQTRPFTVSGDMYSIIAIAAVLLTGAIGGLSAFAHHEQFKIVTERAYRRIVALLYSSVLLFLIYPELQPSGAEILLFLPVSLIAIDFFSERIRRATSAALQIIVITALILGKLSQCGFIHSVI